MRAKTRRSVRARRGSAYILILAVSVILTVIGLSAAAIARVETRSVRDQGHWAEAQQLAFSAAEHALTRIAETPSWRTAFRGKATEVSFAGGTFRWELVDKADGDLADNPQDPFDILATGSMGQTVYRLDLRCAVTGEALAALKTAVHSGKRIDVQSNRWLIATGAPVSTNGELKTGNRLARVTGDVEADSVSGRGRIDGKVSVPAPPKELPASGVVETYRDMANSLGKRTKISREVLGPGRNPWGKPNASGIYFIDARKKTVTIENARIYGTLVVRCRKLVLKGMVLLHPYRENCPVLVVDGDMEMSFLAGRRILRERLARTNLNPPGAPYDGRTDQDTRDAYPSEVRGLAYVSGNVEMSNTAGVRGTILCGGELKCRGINWIVHDPKLAENPPVGFSSGNGGVVPETWARLVD